jgi:hypothetical protein
LLRTLENDEQAPPGRIKLQPLTTQSAARAEQNLTSRFTKYGGTLGAAVFGGFVAVVAWFMPVLIGSGDALSQS